MPPNEPLSRDERINEAIAAYLEAVEQGQTVDRDQFLAEHSEIASELKSFMENLAAVRGFSAAAPILMSESNKQQPVSSTNEPAVTILQPDNGNSMRKDEFRRRLETSGGGDVSTFLAMHPTASLDAQVAALLLDRLRPSPTAQPKTLDVYVAMLPALRSRPDLLEQLDTDPTVLFVVCQPSTDTGGDQWAMQISETPAGDTVEPGQILQSRYRIERELGRGAMGNVYLATDLRLLRPVAVKVSQICIDRNAPASAIQHSRKQFQDEARLGASLNHPGIASIHDYGFQGDIPFAVFEYLKGQTLRAYLKKQRRLSLEETQQIISRLAVSLDYAQGRHVVHRDLKPDNIRSNELGEFKILDLGLARHFARETEWRGFAGTPAYASPEQASGQPCDGRSDQYALALITYELLIGERVFNVHTITEVLLCHRRVVPTWVSDAGNGLPEFVCKTLAKALAKSPEDRFSTCQDFAAAIGCRFVSESEPSVAFVRECPAVEIGSSRAERLIDVSESWMGFSVGRWLLGEGLLALTENAVCWSHNNVVDSIPLHAVQLVAPHGAFEPETQKDHRLALQVFDSHQPRLREVKMLGIGHYFVSTVLIFLWLMILAPAASFQVWTTYILPMFAVGFAVVGWNLRSFKTWARWAAIVDTGALCIVFLAMMIGFLTIMWSRGQLMPGNALNGLVLILVMLFCGSLFGYYLIMLAGRSGRYLFSAECRQARAIGQRTGKKPSAQPLSISFSDHGVTRHRRFRLSHSERAADWAAAIAAHSERQVDCTEPQSVAVALLKSKPLQRFQVLGSITSSGVKGDVVEAALLLQTAARGADAVVDVTSERLPGFASTVLRLHGIAVNAVDTGGIAEFASHWFASRVSRLSRWMMTLELYIILFQVIGFIFDIMGNRAQFNSTPSIAELVSGLFLMVILHLWPFVAITCLFFLQWPQIVRPVTLALVVQSAGRCLFSITTVAGFVVSGKNAPWMLAFAIISPENLALVFLSYALFRSGEKSLERLQTYFGHAQSPSPTRSALAMIGYLGTIGYGLLFLAVTGLQLWNLITSRQG